MSSTQEVGEIFGEGSGPAQAMLRSPTVLIASVGLWGMNVYMFRLFGIDFVHVLNLDLNKEREELAKSPPKATEKNRKNSDVEVEALVVASEENGIDFDLKKSDEEPLDDASREAVITGGGSITWSKLVSLSVTLLVLLHLTIYVWIQVLGGGSIGAVFAFYGAVLAGIVVPFPSTRWLRKATVTVLQRAFELLNPRCSCVAPDPAGPRPIPFIDVFFADAMCSLSKVFFDWGMLFHMAAHYPDPVPKELDTILIPSFCAAIPYIIRARQCLIMYNLGRIKSDPKRYQHVLNAIKYSTSIFPLCLSAFQQTRSPERAKGLEVFLIILLTINASYSLAWDIIMDWGMMKNPAGVIEHTCVTNPPLTEMRAPSCGHAILRPRLRFGVLMSTVILLSDAVLRFSWTLRFHEKLFPSKDHFVLATQFLEVFRRAIWNLLRVEWENLKQTEAKKKALKQEKAQLFIGAPKSIEMGNFHGHRS